MTSFSRGILIYPLYLLFSFSVKKGGTNHDCEREKNVVLGSLENVENKLIKEILKNIKENFDSRDLSFVDRLSGLKYSHEDKIKKVKSTDEELLNLLKQKEYKVECEKILKREDIPLQVIAPVERCLKKSKVENNFTSSPHPSTPPTSVK